MSEKVMLLTAITTLSGVVVVLWGIVWSNAKTTESRLIDCEDDRKQLRDDIGKTNDQVSDLISFQSEASRKIDECEADRTRLRKELQFIADKIEGKQ